MLPNDDDLITDAELDALLDESGDLLLEQDEIEANEDDALELDEDGEEVATETAPSLTYAFNFETGEIVGKIDEKQALNQFIVKALITARDEFVIYSSEYGSEIDEILAEQEGIDYATVEMERVCREALETDDRIIAVDSVESTFADDRIYVSLEISSIYGDITEEVEI